MDANHFDALIRALTSKPSRRGLLATLPFVFGVSDAAAKKRKRRKKKKKPVKPCTRNCTGKSCGADGCGGSCGSCGGGQSCQNGTCVAGCVPACTGGRFCNPSSGQCECPPDRPHSGGFCDDTCRECCIDDHCGRFNGKRCDHTQGSICVCASATAHDCDLLCQTCCAAEHCIPIIGDQSRCVEGGCRCNPGLTLCFDGVSGKNKCVDTHTSPGHCSECGRDCPPGTQCIDSNCV